ncbi:sulfatase-like hydrolase/transferase [Ramlibacter sp. PS4R-6]|uniref:sulfatase-like hydrolase/transferase n=1 Tax=Ramlibacter sp. PS4R-6 TaxID=3133438 RepID=UPI0030B575FB
MQPNILFILTDNQGWRDMGIYGNPYFQTPHLDALARSGVMFRRAYASAPMCTPSRDALYTGRYPGRNAIGIREPLAMASLIGDKVGLSPDEPTIVSLLKDKGYATALVGKWHLGYLPTYSPLKIGFDEHFGNKAGSMDYFRHVDAGGNPDMWENDQLVDHSGTYVTELYTNRAIDYIRRNREQPFLLCLFYTAPHWPWEGPNDKAISDSLKGKDNQRNWMETGTSENYSEVMRGLDDGVGRVLAALKETGQDENTLVIFVSDQGGDELADSGHLRRGRLHENGIRVPQLVRWTGVIPPGQVTDQVVVGMDLSATILAAAGAKPAPGWPLDGEDLMPVLLGKKPPYDRRLFWRHHGFPRPGIPEQGAHLDGHWKYYVSGEHEALYDLAADESELHDLKEREPQRFRQLRDTYRAWAAQMLPYKELHE